MVLRRPASIPVVTVIIPIYNRTEFVSRAIGSVIRQSMVDWELIIVDDASTTDVESEISTHLGDQRIKLIRRSVNGGLAAARNSGLQQAVGRFVCFLDDDDEFLEHKLAHQVAQLEAATDDVIGVAGVTQEHDDVDVVVKELNRTELLLSSRSTPGVCSFLLRRHEAAQIGFDESLRAAEDWDFYIRLLEQYRITCDTVPVAKYHRHDSGHLSASISMLWAKVQLFDKYLPEIRRVRQAHAKWHDSLAISYLSWGYHGHARRHLISSLVVDPRGLSRWYRLASLLLNSSPRSRVNSSENANLLER